MCGNLSRLVSTTRTVVSRSERVDSAFLMHRLSCFFVSLIAWVFVAVSCEYVVVVLGRCVNGIGLSLREVES